MYNEKLNEYLNRHPEFSEVRKENLSILVEEYFKNHGSENGGLPENYLRFLEQRDDGYVARLAAFMTSEEFRQIPKRLAAMSAHRDLNPESVTTDEKSYVCIAVDLSKYQSSSSSSYN